MLPEHADTRRGRNREWARGWGRERDADRERQRDEKRRREPERERETEHKRDEEGREVGSRRPRWRNSGGQNWNPVDVKDDFRRASVPITRRDSETRVTVTLATRNPPDPRALMPDPSPSFFLSLLYCFFSTLYESQRERNHEMRETEWEGDSGNWGGRVGSRECESEERLGGRERELNRERDREDRERTWPPRGPIFSANHGGSEQRTPAELEDTIPGEIFGGD